MSETLVQGLTIMCIGMGTVLAFLCLLIVSMHVMSYIVGKLNKIFPQALPETAGNSTKTSSSNDEEIAVAIVSAMFKK